MPEKAGRGFRYKVSKEQLAAFSQLSDLEKLEWLEQARLFTLAAQTPITAKRHESLRKGR